MVYPAATERFDGPIASSLDIGGDNQIPGLAQVRLDLDTEVSVRAAADSALQTAINNEATTRAAADTALDGRVTTVEAFDARFQYASLAAGQQLTSNSTTMQNVTGIKVTMVASGFYRFECTILYNCTPAADFQFQFTVPGGAVLRANVTGIYVDAGATTQPGFQIPAATAVNAVGNSAVLWIEIAGTALCGATPGDLQLQAAQNTGTVEITDFVSSGTNIFGFKVN